MDEGPRLSAVPESAPLDAQDMEAPVAAWPKLSEHESSSDGGESDEGSDGAAEGDGSHARPPVVTVEKGSGADRRRRGKQKGKKKKLVGKSSSAGLSSRIGLGLQRTLRREERMHQNLEGGEEEAEDGAHATGAAPTNTPEAALAAMAARGFHAGGANRAAPAALGSKETTASPEALRQSMRRMHLWRSHNDVGALLATADSPETQETRTIMTCDIVNFSGMMNNDEEAVVRLLVDNYYTLTTSQVEAQGGVLFRKEGDAVWCAFKSARAATRAAIAIQEQLFASNLTRPPHQQFQLRIGVHMGDVYLTQDGEILGHTLSVAKRLETACEPGCVLVSDVVKSQMSRSDMKFHFEDLGPVKLKGINDVHCHQGRMRAARRELLEEEVFASSPLGGPSDGFSSTDDSSSGDTLRALLLADLTGMDTMCAKAGDADDLSNEQDNHDGGGGDGGGGGGSSDSAGATVESPGAVSEAPPSMEWERRAIHLCNTLDGLVVRGTNRNVLLLSFPGAAMRQLVREVVVGPLRGARMVLALGDVLVDANEDGDTHVYGATVDRALWVLRNVGMQSRRVLASDVLVERLGESLREVGFCEFGGKTPTADVFFEIKPHPPMYKARMRTRRKSSLQLSVSAPSCSHNPQVVSTVRTRKCAKGNKVYDVVDVLGGLERGAPAIEHNSRLSRLYATLCIEVPVMSRHTPVLSLESQKLLAADSGIGLAVCLAVLGSHEGRTGDITRTIAIGSVSASGKVYAQANIEAQIAAAAEYTPCTLVMPNVMERIDPIPGVTMVRVGDLAHLRSWMQRTFIHGVVDEVVEHTLASNLTVVIDGPAGGRDDLRHCAQYVTANLAIEESDETSFHAMMEEFTDEVGIRALDRTFRRWVVDRATEVPSTPLMELLRAMQPKMVVFLFPDPRWERLFADNDAVTTTHLGGTLGGALCLTEEELETKLYQTFSAMDPVMERHLTNPLLALATERSTKPLQMFFTQMRFVLHTNKTQAVYFHATGLRKSDKRYWEHRNVALVEASLEELHERVVAASGPDSLLTLAGRRKTSQGFHARASMSVAGAPYKPMGAFTRSDPHIFFGREREIDELASRITSHPLVVVHGPAGVGKSSLLNAGLSQVLRRPRDILLFVKLTTKEEGTTPSEQLRIELGNMSKTAPAALSADPAEQLTGLIRRIVRILSGHLVIVLDRAEQLRDQPLDVRSLIAKDIATITKVVRSERVHVVIGVQDEHLGTLLHVFHPYLPTILDVRYPVEPLRGESIAHAICKPAALFDIDVESALVSAIQEDLCAHVVDVDGVHPALLQMVLNAVFASATDPHHLTLATYEALGRAQLIVERMVLGVVERAQEVSAPGTLDMDVVVGLLQLASPKVVALEMHALGMMTRVPSPRALSHVLARAVALTKESTVPVWKSGGLA